jgi:hypothetical protein
MPKITNTVYSNGMLGVGVVTHMANGAKKMINDINGEVSTVGIGTYPAIFSRVGVGQTKEIQKIAVGRVLDTQRRRRNALVESPVYIDL